MQTTLDQVAKIVVYQGSYFSFLYGFRFLNINGEVLLEVGRCTQPPTEFNVSIGERVLGIKSRLDGKVPFHNDIQFVIGRL